MTREYCKYECGTKLGDFDEDEHKYKEQETGYLHTQERCKAAKDKQETQTETSKKNEEKLKKNGEIENKPSGYLDHTKQGIAQLKIFSNKNALLMETDANTWFKNMASKIRFRGGQFAMTDVEGEERTYAVCLWYEES